MRLLSALRAKRKVEGGRRGAYRRGDASNGVEGATEALKWEEGHVHVV